jgi:hypothetical protein
MSFAFNTISYRHETVKGVKVHVLEVLDLMDASDVQWGMNPKTMAAVKGPAVLNTAKLAFLRDRKETLGRVQKMVAETEYERKENVRKAVLRAKLHSIRAAHLCS